MGSSLGKMGVWMGSEDLTGLTVTMCTSGDRDRIRDSDKCVWEL